jgi:hypothetical protein
MSAPGAISGVSALRVTDGVLVLMLVQTMVCC